MKKNAVLLLNYILILLLISCSEDENPLPVSITLNELVESSKYSLTVSADVSILNEDVIDHGFNFGGEAIVDSIISLGVLTSTGTITQTINGLQPNKSYSLRFYVTTSSGTTYTDFETFNTASFLSSELSFKPNIGSWGTYITLYGDFSGLDPESNISLDVDFPSVNQFGGASTIVNVEQDSIVFQYNRRGLSALVDIDSEFNNYNGDISFDLDGVSVNLGKFQETWGFYIKEENQVVKQGETLTILVEGSRKIYIDGIEFTRSTWATNEGTAHYVTIPNDFAIGSHKVTVKTNGDNPLALRDVDGSDTFEVIP